MSCTYYRYNNEGLFGDYWCDKKNDRVDSDTYYKYCRNYDYSACPIYKQSDSSGCFITTVACKILGKSDNDDVLNNLRFLRDKVLKSNPKYYYLLKDYDKIGPKIADAILHDKDRVIMANTIYNKTLVPVSKMISDKKYDQAICNYEFMTNLLVNYYGLEDLYDKSDDKDFDLSTSGHGRIRVLNNHVSEVNN